MWRQGQSGAFLRLFFGSEADEMLARSSDCHSHPARHVCIPLVVFIWPLLNSTELVLPPPTQLSNATAPKTAMANNNQDHRRRNSGQQNDISPEATAKSPLFKLPPEVRNLIYRHSLVKSNGYRVTRTAGVPEPGLLTASKLIRAEASGIFYYENDFTIKTCRFDPTGLLLMQRKLGLEAAGWADGERQLKIPKHFQTDRIHLSGHRMRNWRNFKRCMRLVYTSELLILPVGRFGSEAEAALVKGMLGMVAQFPSMSARRLDLLLETMRPSFVAIHASWSSD